MGTKRKPGAAPELTRWPPQTLVWIRLGRARVWLARVEQDDGGKALWLRLVGLEGGVRVMVPRAWVRRAVRAREG